MRHEHESADDASVLKITDLSNRILIAVGRDFGELVVRQKLPVAAILLLALNQLSNQADADRVRAVVASESNLLIGHLVVVEPSRLRRRSLT